MGPTYRIRPRSLAWYILCRWMDAETRWLLGELASGLLFGILFFGIAVVLMALYAR